MTFAPKTLTDLMAYWKAQGGVNLGIVGDAAHQARATYHNGRDVIEKYGRTAATDYSIRLARDRAGLTNAAAAVDLGKLDGSLDKERTFARWFAGQCFANAPGYRAQVREVIFWSNVRGLVLGWSSLDPDRWIENYGDGSHEWHAHISFFRDTEFRDKVALFSAYPLFAPPPPAPGDDVPNLASYIPGQVATIKPTANVRADAKLTASIIRVVATAETWTVTGWVKGDVDPDGGSDQWLTRWNAGKWEYTAKSNVSSGPAAPAAPPDTSPFTQADVDAASLAGKQAGYDLAKTGVQITHPAPTVTWPPRP